jgi:hypothetical protein
MYNDWGRPEKAAAWRAERAAEVDVELRDTAFIRDWLLLAPLPLPGPPRVNPADQDPVAGEARLRPRAGDKAVAGGREFVWAAQRAGYSFLDFNWIVGRLSPQAVAYAVCYVVCDEERRDLQIRLNSDDQSKLYVNGQEVYRSAVVRSLTPTDYPVPGVTFRKGTNILVFKVVNMGGEWRGRLQIVDKEGRWPVGVTVRLTPDAPPPAGQESPPKP